MMTIAEKKVYTKLFKRFCKDHGLYRRFCCDGQTINYWCKNNLRYALAPFNLFTWRTSAEGYEYWYTRCLLFCEFIIDYALEHKGVFNLREIYYGGQTLLSAFNNYTLFGEYKDIHNDYKKKLDKLWSSIENTEN